MAMLSIPELMARFALNDWKETLIDLLQQKLVEYEVSGVAVDRVYPRKAPPPKSQALIVVQRSSVREEPAGIGRVLGERIDPVTGQEILTEGAWQVEEAEITIWANNGDLRDWLFLFVRGVVFECVPDLLRYGFRDVLLTHSVDDEIDDQLITNFYWYRASCSFSCRTEIGADYRAPLATSVEDTAITQPAPPSAPESSLDDVD